MKRLLDVLLSLVFMMIFAPIGLVIAVMIKLDSPGPVLFRQRRYGANGKTFLIYKFRTMTVMETEGSFTQATVGDSRVTRIGRVLRSSSLDEMPQLVNVLAGEMSLVGPRPHAIPMDDAFAPVIENYNDRYLVRPGLTGLAQVTGHRGPTESINKIRLRVLCDRNYIRDWSIWLDLVILAKTALVLRGPNAV